MEKSLLMQEVVKWRAHFYRGQKLWSLVHHASLFGSIVCSVVAGALVQSQPAVAAWLSSTAAALTSLALAGGFDRKWKSNRLSRSRIDGLLIDLEDENQNLAEISNQFKEIILKHDAEIVGSEHHVKNTHGKKNS